MAKVTSTQRTVPTFQPDVASVSQVTNQETGSHPDSFASHVPSSVGETHVPAGNATQKPGSTLLRFLLGRDTSASVDFYRGKDLSLTDSERALLDKGDLHGFWESRLGKDPVARIALGIWGGDKPIEKGIEEIDKEYWYPSVNVVANIALQFQKPSDVKANPETDQELKDYWLWLGNDAREHVERFVRKSGMLDGAEDPAALESSLVKQVGLNIAREHAAELDRDLAESKGEVPGLLSRRQIAEYHHRALKDVDLPPEAYGGTPLSFVPDFMELWLAGGIYAHDGDPND